jgi:hypothetical protein
VSSGQLLTQVAECTCKIWYGQSCLNEFQRQDLLNDLMHEMHVPMESKQDLEMTSQVIKKRKRGHAIEQSESSNLFRCFQANSFSCTVSCEFYIVAFAFLLFLASSSACVCISPDGILGAFRIYNLATSPSNCILAIICLRSRYDLP